MKLKLTVLLLLLTPLTKASPALAACEKNLPTGIIMGLSIKAPAPEGINAFLTFMNDVLAPAGVNVLVLRVDYNYAYESHPELRSANPLTREMVQKLVLSSQENGIALIPQINLLGHQSWHSTHSKLLSVYPEFDETPHVQLPENYEWPNEDGLYCKSYCPLHPRVHEVVFALVDEIMEAFSATAFHAGMDEVFYLADEKCPRCHGLDPAVLFADEVRRIRNHLHTRDQQLWIWGDRLLDGNTTGLGIWEAAGNQTHTAIDLIPNDVVICDWHYDRAEPTAAYFALKGFNVITCPWNNSSVAKQQVAQFVGFQESSNGVLAQRYRGLMQTIWTDAKSFIDAYHSPESASEKLQTQVNCFKTLSAEVAEIPKK